MTELTLQEDHSLAVFQSVMNRRDHTLTAEQAQFKANVERIQKELPLDAALKTDLSLLKYLLDSEPEFFFDLVLGQYLLASD